MKSQIAFVVSTLKGKDIGLIGQPAATKVLKALNSGNATTAATVFCNTWERPGVPHLQKRIDMAKQYCKDFYGV